MRSFFILFTVLLLGACSKQTEEYTTTAVADYAPYKVGGAITYRLDSTVFVSSGNKIEVHKYQVRHLVSSTTADGAGHTVYVINRFINNEAGTAAWNNNGTYTVTVFPDRLETFDNNLRVVNLAQPFTAGYSWHGNRYLPVSPYNGLYKMSLAGITLNQWAFTYAPFADTIINNTPYTQVCTVMQNNFVQNIPAPSPNSVGIMEVGTEKYAKGVGLIYKNLQLYEHQPPNVDAPQETYIGFGITMWAISHN